LKIGTKRAVGAFCQLLVEPTMPWRLERPLQSLQVNLRVETPHVLALHNPVPAESSAAKRPSQMAKRSIVSRAIGSSPASVRFTTSGACSGDTGLP
jgi:hypothetical protein